MEVNDPAQPEELEIIFYAPDQNSNTDQPTTRRRSDIPIWERLTDQLQRPTTQRLKAEEYLKLFPPSIGETALEITRDLASGLSHDKEQRHISGLLLLSLCATLDHSGRVAPEEIDEVIRTLTTSKNPKYLDKLKRGARVANKIIAQWAERKGGDQLLQLDRATQAILQGRDEHLYRICSDPQPDQLAFSSARLTVSQWSVLGEYSTAAKERIVSRALPQMAMGDGPPVSIPLLISHLVKDSLSYVLSLTTRRSTNLTMSQT